MSVFCVRGPHKTRIAWCTSREPPTTTRPRAAPVSYKFEWRKFDNYQCLGDLRLFPNGSSLDIGAWMGHVCMSTNHSVSVLDDRGAARAIVLSIGSTCL